MSFRHFWAVTRKEFQHIFRDRQTFILVMFTPLFILVVMAYAVTVDIQHVPVAVLDYERSSASRAFYNKIFAGDDLDFYLLADSMDDIEDLFMEGVR